MVSGAWFIRVGSMLWNIFNNNPAGFDPVAFQGPLLNFLSFAHYLTVCARGIAPGAPGKFAMAAGLVVLTIAMGVGIFGATMRLWLPHI